MKRWKDLWLNEGFATYANWLWTEHRGGFSVQEMYELYANFPADDEFWRHPTADPGVENLFGSAVYDRGALTLHTLRLTVGDATFFRILKAWAARHKDGNVTTSQFTALAEQMSGRDLDALFDTWLYRDGKPAGFEPPPESRLTATARRDLAWEERSGLVCLRRDLVPA